jgi:hypothetical protein
MKRIFSTLYTVLISTLVASLAFASGIPGSIGNMPPMAPQEGHGVVFRYDPSRNPTLDFASRTNLTQTYAGTNRTRTNAQGLLEAVPAHTVVIDHVGASLTPALRMEPAGANILLGTPPVTQDLTLPTGSFTLQVWDTVGTATVSAGTATITGAGEASKGTPVTFVVTVAGTVTVTIDTAVLVKLELGAIPTSYFAGAAAIGDELVTDGTFDVVTTGAAVNSGLLTVGNCYKIASRTDGDFVSAGAPDNNVGTYFNATTTGVGLLDAGDTVNPITFTNWTAGAGWAPQATAGVLTGKAQKIAGTASNLVSVANVVSLNSVNRTSFEVGSMSGGSLIPYAGGSAPGTSVVADGVYVQTIINNGANLKVYLVADVAFAGTVDDVSVKEHGTVRLSEAGTLQTVTDAKVAAAMADKGTLAMKIRFPYANTAVSGVVNILTTSGGNMFYLDAIGRFIINDGTNTAINNDGFLANTDYILIYRWGKTGAKMDVGFGLPGAINFDFEGDFGGAFSTVGNITYLMHTIGQGGAHIYWIKVCNKILADAQINALR